MQLMDFTEQYTPCITGSGGLTVANQIRDRFRSAGKALAEDDIAILDAADYHYYQVRNDTIVTLPPDL